MALTKQDLDAIKTVVKKEIDDSLEEKLDLKLAFVHQEIPELKNDISGLREQIQELAVTLDKFVK